jgi:hypothetical protein
MAEARNSVASSVISSSRSGSLYAAVFSRCCSNRTWCFNLRTRFRSRAFSSSILRSAALSAAHESLSEVRPLCRRVSECQVPRTLNPLVKNCSKKLIPQIALRLASEDDCGSSKPRAGDSVVAAAGSGTASIGNGETVLPVTVPRNLCPFHSNPAIASPASLAA